MHSPNITGPPRTQDFAAVLATTILHVTFLHLQQRWLEGVPELKTRVADIIREEFAAHRLQDLNDMRPNDEQQPAAICQQPRGKWNCRSNYTQRRTLPMSKKHDVYPTKYFRAADLQDGWSLVAQVEMCLRRRHEQFMRLVEAAQFMHS